MGYSIRSLVFEPRSPVRLQFSRFPVQVAVLFSPHDGLLADHLKRQFYSLHQDTGRDLVFVALLEPPADWLSDQANRRWWSTYVDHFCPIEYSLDDRVLLGELVRLFGLSWGDLPVIVASTDLWETEFVTCPTTAQVLDEQLLELTQLAKREDPPSIAMIMDTLQAVTGMPVRHHRQDHAAYRRLSNFYKSLSTHSDPKKHARALQSQLTAMGPALQTLRNDQAKRDADESADDSNRVQGVELAIANAAGPLVPLASAAEKMWGQLVSLDLPDSLDETSEVLLTTSRKIGWLLETQFPEGRLPRFERQHRGSHADRGQRFATPWIAIDYTPGAQGAWKAFERELHLSAIQAARHSRGIPMPDAFALYHRPLGNESYLVSTGRGGPKDLNKRGDACGSGYWQEPLTLGAAYWVIKTMLDDPKEALSPLIQTALGKPFPVQTLGDWKEIYKIRNTGSHVEPLTKQDYEKVIQVALSPTVLEPLLQLKKALKNAESGSGGV